MQTWFASVTVCRRKVFHFGILIRIREALGELKRLRLEFPSECHLVNQFDFIGMFCYLAHIAVHALGD